MVPQCLQFAVQQHKYVYCKQYACVSSVQCQLVGELDEEMFEQPSLRARITLTSFSIQESVEKYLNDHLTILFSFQEGLNSYLSLLSASGGDFFASVCTVTGGGSKS